MSAKKPSVTFNDFWPFFCQEARGRGYNQTDFMKICGLPKTRYNSFMKSDLSVTAYYCNKIMEGLRMTEDYVEKKSGIKFTDEQRRALRRATWTDHHPEIIDALSSDKKLTKLVLDYMTKNEKNKT
jgi:hypothetical protein